jgi:hypothetical protein
MLDFVEEQTSRKFITADKTNAPHFMQFWYYRPIAEYRCTKYFSNRPFSKGYDQKPIRAKEFMPETEQFLRLDLELPDHDQIPSQSTREGIIAWAKNAGAMASLQTPHGTHVYFLFEERFLWTQAKSIVQNLMDTYDGEYIACDASWCTSDWSRSNNNKNVNLDFFSKKKQQQTFLYCETISTSNKKAVSTSKSKTKNKNRQISRKGGSRQENNDEFKSVWWAIKNGQSVDQATSNLKFHTKQEIVKALNDPKYAIRSTNTKKATEGQHGQIGKILDGTSEYVGSFSETRSIQRNSSVFAQIAHSISDLRATDNDNAIRILETVPKFENALALVKANYGENWKKETCQLLDNNRELYGTQIGRLYVSPVILDICLDYLKNNKVITCKELNNHLTLTLPLPCSEYAAHGSSVQHTKRILNLLVKSGILTPHYAGRSTTYEPVTITKLLLDQLSSENIKQPSNTRTRDTTQEAVQEDQQRPVRTTDSVQNERGSTRNPVQSREHKCESGHNPVQQVGLQSKTSRIPARFKIHKETQRCSTRNCSELGTILTT